MKDKDNVTITLPRDQWEAIRDQVQDVKEPERVEVPEYNDRSYSIDVWRSINSGEDHLLYVYANGVSLPPSAALKLARALVVGACALEGVAVKSWRSATPRRHMSEAGPGILAYIDDLLAGLDA